LRRDDRAERPKKFEKKFDRAERPERVERPDPDSYAQRKSRENRGERLVKARPVRESLPAANIFGFHASRAAWLNPARVIKSIYLTEAGAKTFEDTAREALDAGLSRPIALQVEKDVLDKMLPRDAVHQGVALVAEALDEISVQDFVIAAQAREKTVLVMLDQVTDPHNVGAIIRSACAFGAAGMIMQKMHAPEMEGTLLKSASGAAEHMPVAYETNLSRAIEELKEGGFFVIGLAEEGEKDLATLARTAGGKIVLVMGSEGAGMRRLVREHCDALAHLPVTGPVKSLNVSNAAAVALYAVTQG
jgi:23S rRNA (guanosine2251-2'-O)-methyltransferase